MSRLISAVLRNSVPMLPNPPEFDTAAAIAAAAKTAIGPRMIGTSMPRTSHSTVEASYSSSGSRHPPNQADPIRTKTPIIAVSSFAMMGDEEKARTAGCDHYVTQPYIPLRLLRTIRSVLGEQA